MPDRASRLPPLDLVKGFEAAARLSNITQAAAELFLTQSAVSRQVKALEAHLGVTLFHRRQRGLELTEAGRRYFDAASQALKLLKVAGDDLRGAPRTLTVTTTPGFASLWLIPRLADFTRAHRDIDVRISATYESLDLERMGVDFAIRYGAAKPAGAAWLFGERLLPVCSPALRNDPERPLKVPADLRHHVLLQIENDHTGVPWMDWTTWFRAIGMAEAKPAGLLRFARYDEVIAAAVAGQGIAPGGMPLLRQHLRDGRLVAPFTNSIASPRGYFLVESKTSDKSEAARDFARWIRGEAAGAKVDPG
jgi:LysR family transcriptional regulator, glycine cleavage system transcriptional activator